MKFKFTGGFNLLELMITLAVFAIIAGISLPSFLDLINRIQFDSYSNNFRNSIRLANSESVKRGVSITMCTSNSDSSDCSGNAGWENGWLIKETVTVSGRDPIVMIHEPLQDTFSLRGDSSNNTTQFTFSASGLNSGTGNFVLCRNRSVDENSKLVTLNQFGKTKLKGTDSVTIRSCQA
ncbi:MAG: prepilin-type N-terminal cleavage/methylation domain-containing protein [Alteromonadales bacterium]|nr:prepilin-type N-terminal cleavage/methylation domain-containing protein [Alteromonadales bacterium]